jgi:hypothetical protein
MERTIRELRGTPVVANDGLAGPLRDLYFDDGRWAVRGLRVDASTWLPGRLVLIPVSSVRPADPLVHLLRLGLPRRELAERRVAGELDARSAISVLGYRVAAIDGAVGRVDDLVIDDVRWLVTSLLVHASDLLPGTIVRVAPAAVASIDFVHRTVRVVMTREQVRHLRRANAESRPAGTSPA